MKTTSLLLALILSAGFLSACTKSEKPVSKPASEASDNSTGGETSAPVATKESEPDYLRRDIDTNIKEGNAAMAAKDYDRAERILLSALKQCDLYTKQEARQGAILNSLAAIYEEKEMYAQAVPLLNKAQKLFIRSFGRQSQPVYITLGNLGRVLGKQYRWQEAADVYQTAVNLMSEDAKASQSQAYKEMLNNCREAWKGAGNAFKANKIEAKLKALK